jgi:DNA-binding response OmpR family regulator
MGKILVVDDDPGTTKLLEMILAREGYDVVSVNHGPDTLPSALNHHPNLILLDLIMPGLDGLEVCRDLRTNVELAKTPIIFFTSVSDIDKKVAAFGSGANDYIIKPIHPRELKLRINAFISKGNGHRRGN